MRKSHRSIVLFLIAITCFVGGCGDETEALPQEKGEIDLAPDQDSPSTREVAFAPPLAGGARFDRAKARDYIERYALAPNPNLAYCGQWVHEGTRVAKEAADCTNFASQVLWYAGLPLQYGSAEEGWWYKRGCTDEGSSKSWRQVNRLLQYLVVETNLGELKKRARDLKVGDLILYRLRRESDGYRCDGNLLNHSSVVSGFDDQGEPLVAYHSNEALGVPWNAKNGSKKSLGESCLTAFVHIKD